MEAATIRKLNDSTLVLTVGNMIAIIDTVAPGVIVLGQPTEAPAAAPPAPVVERGPQVEEVYNPPSQTAAFEKATSGAVDVSKSPPPAGWDGGAGDGSILRLRSPSGNVQRMVVAMLREFGTLSTAELAHRLNMTIRRINDATSGLLEYGRVRNTGERRHTSTHPRKTVVWELVGNQSDTLGAPKKRGEARLRKASQPILDVIADKAMTTQEISESLPDLPYGTVSGELHNLRAMKLVDRVLQKTKKGEIAIWERVKSDSMNGAMHAG